MHPDHQSIISLTRPTITEPHTIDKTHRNMKGLPCLSALEARPKKLPGFRGRGREALPRAVGRRVFGRPARPRTDPAPPVDPPVRGRKPAGPARLIRRPDRPETGRRGQDWPAGRTGAARPGLASVARPMASRTGAGRWYQIAWQVPRARAAPLAAWHWRAAAPACAGRWPRCTACGVLRTGAGDWRGWRGAESVSAYRDHIQSFICKRLGDCKPAGDRTAARAGAGRTMPAGPAETMPRGAAGRPETAHRKAGSDCSSRLSYRREERLGAGAMPAP